MSTDWTAEKQQRLADAIRACNPVISENVAEIILRHSEPDCPPLAHLFASIESLAAAAHDDRIWDALVQVRQGVAFERAIEAHDSLVEQSEKHLETMGITDGIDGPTTHAVYGLGWRDAIRWVLGRKP